MNQDVKPDINLIINELAKRVHIGSEVLQRTIVEHREQISGFVLAMQPYADAMSLMLSKLSEVVDAISSEIQKRRKSADELINVQFVSLGWLEGDFVDEVLSAGDTDQLNRILEERFCNKGNDSVAEIAEKCREHKLMTKYTHMFKQCMDAFQNGSYDLAIMGLCAIIDGLLSEITSDLTTSMPFRTEKLLELLEAKYGKIDDRGSVTYAISLRSVYDVIVNTYGAWSDFKEEEPEFINRHWIMHGRATRARTKLDFLKVLRLLYGLLLLGDLIQEKDNAA